MKSDTTFDAQIPVEVFGCAPSGGSVSICLRSQMELTADEHESVMNRAMLFVRDLAALLTDTGLVKAPGALNGESGPEFEHWIGIRCSMGDGIVALVKTGGPAYMADILAGDRIVAVNGVPFGPDAVGPAGKWSTEISRTQPGDTVFIDLERANSSPNPVRKTVVRPGFKPGAVL